MKLLIAYSTTEGQTRKIAEYIRSATIKACIDTRIGDTAAEVQPPDGFDAVIICASIHMHRYQAAVTDYLRRYYSILNDKPSEFLAVSLSAVNATEDDESYREMKDITDKFLFFTRWAPSFTDHVAGALRFTKYDFMKKYIMRLIAKKTNKQVSGEEDVEYTDWEKLSEFIAEFIQYAHATATKLSKEIG